MKNVQAVKIGNMLNISIEGKLFKKNCGNSQLADELFKLALKAKSDPSDENILTLRLAMKERARVALVAGFEADADSGEFYLAGFNTPVPETLIEVVKDYVEKGYPTDAIVNFWKLLMINPDKRVRTSLFQFITTHDFVLTDKGYMVVYKAVKYKDDQKPENSLEEFVTNQYLHVRKDWKCSPNKYVVYRNVETGALAITKFETAQGWDEKKEGVEVLGKLGDMFSAIVEANNKATENGTVKYTDKYTGTMTIQLGVPVKMERKDCDSDPAVDCSYGLHVGATKYVERFASSDNPVLVCLVNPAHVVAVPEYDHSKMRVSEYFPYALATYTGGKIDIIEEKFFEADYQTFEQKEVEEMIAKVKASEPPIGTALDAEDESRPMDELMKMLETRLIEVSVE